MSLFRGCGVALVTPFDDRGEVNERALHELIDFQITGGIDAIVVCGSTGEGAALFPEEHARVVSAAVDAVAGRVPLIAGVGGSGTAMVARLGRAAAAAGADALLASPPPYNKPSQKGIVAHFRAIVESSDLPMIVYNIPGRTACNILPETVEELAHDSRIVGVKEASGDISQVAELCRRVGDRLAIYSGNDDQVVPLLALGGTGVISVVANLAPGELSRMVHSFLEGDVLESRRLQFRYLPLINALFGEPNPVPVKAGVRELGYDVGEVRLPLTPASPETEHLLREEMRSLGLSGAAGA